MVTAFPQGGCQWQGVGCNGGDNTCAVSAFCRVCTIRIISAFSWYVSSSIASSKWIAGTHARQS